MLSAVLIASYPLQVLEQEANFLPDQNPKPNAQNIKHETKKSKSKNG